MSDKKKVDAPKCQYNSGVECRLREKHCENCGWNPAVANARLKKFRNDHGMGVPDEKEN